MRKLLTYIRALALLLLLATAGYFWAMRQGWTPIQPWRLAVSVIVLCAWMAGELAWAVRRVLRRELRAVGFAARAAMALGGLLVFGGGLANWAYALHGFVLLAEGDAAPFFHGTHLQGFVAGPLSDVREMELVLYLDEVDVVPDGRGGFGPVSKLRLERIDEPVHRFELTPERGAVDGTLRFFQGVFGYAPRIVILHGDATLFDKTVPFTTQLDEGDKVVFVGEFTVAQYGLYVRGEVTLDSLNDAMKGHPVLHLDVSRNDVPLGDGSLRMGHFADLPGDHRIGFAGLKKWAEIDIARKNYPEPMFAGAAMVVLGGIVLVISQALSRRRSA